jgi:hypothetical protein
MAEMRRLIILRSLLSDSFAAKRILITQHTMIYEFLRSSIAFKRMTDSPISGCVAGFGGGGGT